MTTVTIPERIMMNEDIKKTRSSLWFSLTLAPRIKNVGPAARATHAASIETVTLRRLVGV